MKFETFQAGRWVQQYQYKSFSHVTVNREWSWEEPQINTLLARVRIAGGRVVVECLSPPDVRVEMFDKMGRQEWRLN